ncbi:MAG TPA: hypothetical protein VF676_06470 [Flavobacterium sp.]|jgi:hypothetical protein
MSDHKLNITSTVVEKSIDTVKGFLEKLLGSTVEEAGLIFADNMKLRRFRNQLKIWEKAQKIVIERGINPQQISLKALVPLLEFSSLEEEESLQEKWSNLIVNYVDADSKYKSTIFPWILNQISSMECLLLKDIVERDHIYGVNIDRSGVDYSNLVRLGLLERKTLRPTTGLNPRKGVQRMILQMSKGEFVITPLGIEFVNCCSSSPLL